MKNQKTSTDQMRIDWNKVDPNEGNKYRICDNYTKKVNKLVEHLAYLDCLKSMYMRGAVAEYEDTCNKMDYIKLNLWRLIDNVGEERLNVLEVDINGLFEEK